MNNIDKLKESINKLAEITAFTKENYLYTEYFHKPNTKEELELYKNPVYEPHLKFIGHLLFRNLVIEVHKLFSSSNHDKFRLLQILSDVNKTSRIENINLDFEKIKEFKTRIKNEKETIEILQSMRNRAYAHTDTDEFSIFNLPEISFKDIYRLLEIAMEIVNYLHIVFFNSSFLFLNINFDRNRFILLKTLYEGEELRIKNIHESLGFKYNKK